MVNNTPQFCGNCGSKLRLTYATTIINLPSLRWGVKCEKCRCISWEWKR